MNSNKELPGPTLMGAGVGAHAGRRVPQDQPHTGRHRCCPGAVAALIIFVSQGIVLRDTSGGEPAADSSPDNFPAAGRE